MLEINSVEWAAHQYYGWQPKTN